jgi:hypothetical protein
MQEPRRTRPATAADFHRLADLAHERGLRLFRDGTRWYCSSASDTGGCHYVTGVSCDCPGFVAHARCTHHALLLERLGWLPELDSDAPASVECMWCHGTGSVQNEFHQRYEPCAVCGGTGIRPNHHLHDAPAAPMVAVAA